MLSLEEEEEQAKDFIVKYSKNYPDKLLETLLAHSANLAQYPFESSKAVIRTWVKRKTIDSLISNLSELEGDFTRVFFGELRGDLELVFFGSLIPIFLFVLIEIYLLKSFISKNFNQKRLYFDLGKILLIFYFLLILFWIDAHPNILVLPFNFFLDHLSLISGELYSGWPFYLLNGEYYQSWQVPKLHFFINLIYKSP